MPDTSPVTHEDIIGIKEMLARLSERTHAQANEQQREIARNALAPKTADMPLWMKVGLAVGGLVVSIGAFSWNASKDREDSRMRDNARLEMATRQEASLMTRLASLEAWKNDNLGLATRVQAIESGLDTARRIRDQQQQSVLDRIRSMELADQSGTERINAQAQAIAGILPRLEEMLRRQERLENRLGAFRQNGPISPEESTWLTVPLVLKLWED